MLRDLHISNYALIEKLDISFSEGFSVITGETGAGKSIILGALGLLLGARSDAKAIKAGAGKCCVEACFDVSGLGLQEFFQENDIDFDGDECIVRREVTAAGKSRAFVNDTPVSLAKLKEISSGIIDIHSQHQNLLMGHEQFLIDLLDTVAADSSLLDSYKKVFLDWSKACRDLQQLKEQAEKDRTDTEYLQFQLQQLDEAALQDGEQEQLEGESEMLSHAEEIKEALYKVSSGFSSEEHNPLSSLRMGVQSLAGISNVYPEAGDLSERMDSVRIELEDVAGELERALEKVDFDPNRLAFVDERLDTIYRLQKKHGVQTVAALLEIAEGLRERLDKIENIDTYITQKEKEAGLLSKNLREEGGKLTKARKKAAGEIERELLSQLKNLGMPGASLKLELAPKSAPVLSGLDNVFFLFSANKNVPVQDVTQIASGGEIARLMLSLKAIVSRSRHLPTIIFDEIDTGVSGTMAEKMANVMQEMGQNCQVLCITHLPQIAALGSKHYRVYKSETDSGVTSHIGLLTEEERVREIANMLSGAEMTEAALNNAKSLLKIS